MTRAYYNEIDPYAAQWLRNLIANNLIAPGYVDERSIVEVQPADLAGYTQCHFFAGIGVWSHALRSAGWDDSRPVWTGSCPCQPFSSAGKRKGASDERHLWPHLFRLIQACRPLTVFGEQVASSDGLQWLDLVQADLEGAGYASGAVDTCAAGYGAPHIRQRLYWVAHSDNAGSQACWPSGDGTRNGAGWKRGEREPCISEPNGGMAHAHEDRRPVLGTSRVRQQRQPRHDAAGCGEDGGVADPIGERGRGGQPGSQDAGDSGQPEQAGNARPTHGFWGAADWLYCRDARWRPVEPGTFPLAHGATSRVGRLRAYGNAIVAPQAQAFVTAYLQTIENP